MKRILALCVLTILLLLVTSYDINAQYTIQGNVYYHNNPAKPLTNTVVELKNIQGLVIGTAPTDAQGHYIFNNVQSGTYNLNATTNLPSGGINLEDSYLILLHLLNLYTLSPIQTLAADVNGNGTITWSDYFTIVFGWFIYGYPFPVGDWVFQGATVVAGLKDGNTHLGGSSSGDVNGSWQPNITKSSEPLAMIEYNNTIVATSGQIVQIPVYAETSSIINGFAFSLSYPEQLSEVTGIISDYGKIEYQAQKGELRLIWNDETATGTKIKKDIPLFVVELKLKEAFSQNDNVILKIESENQIIGNDGVLLSDYVLKSGSVIWSNTNSNSLRIYPNPITPQSQIALSLKEESTVKIDLYDNSGRFISTVASGIFTAGFHSIHFPKLMLSNGLYHYHCIILGKHQEVISDKIIINN